VRLPEMPFKRGEGSAFSNEECSPGQVEVEALGGIYQCRFWFFFWESEGVFVGDGDRKRLECGVFPGSNFRELWTISGEAIGIEDE
jgi:hypothetical protein